MSESLIPYEATGILSRANGLSFKAAPLLAALLLAFSFTAPTAAQHEHPAGAPTETETWLVTGLRIDDASPPPGSAVARAAARLAGGGYVHIVYGRPFTRGRQVFGGLVAFDQIWATGAHRATELVTTVPLFFGDRRLEPGAYSLFTTPGKERWTLHLNRRLGMHLADEYEVGQDALTATAVPEELDQAVPGLTIDFTSEKGEELGLRIQWDRTSVSFPFRSAE